MSKETKKRLLPDTFSFVQESIGEFFGKIHNEFNLSLADAIKEFTEFHVNSCNYLGHLPETQMLSIYYHFNYNPQENVAVLEKIYFVSPEARHILMNNYLLEVENYSAVPKKSASWASKFFRSEKELFNYEEKFKGLTFFADYNNLDTFQAKKILLNSSWLREKNKQLLILKNMNKNYEDRMLKEAIIKFDLSILEKSSFFKNDKYASFQTILPPNLLVELTVPLDYELFEVPDHLKKEQLIDLNSLKMNISQ